MKQQWMTVEDLAMYYEAMRGDQLANLRTYRSNMRQILAIFGGLRPEKIGAQECQVYTRRRTKQGVGAGTIRRELGVLSAVCCFAVKHKLIRADQLPSIDRPASPPPKDRWLSEPELVKLMDCAKALRPAESLGFSKLEIFLWIAIMTAARFSAILELEWDQVSFYDKLIHFNPKDRKQTKKRRPVVPMSEELFAILSRVYPNRKSSLVLGDKKSLRWQFDKCVEMSGLEGVTPNVLRHTAATHMARRGVDMWVIAGVLGNTLAVCEKNYAHFCPTHGRKAVENIPSPTGGKNV